MSHLEILNGADLLLKRPDLLGIGALGSRCGGVNDRGSLLSRSIRLAHVRAAAVVVLGADSQVVAARLTARVVTLVVAIGAAAVDRLAGRGKTALVRGSRALARLALLGLLVTLLLVLQGSLGQVLIVHNGAGNRRSPRLGKLGARNLTARAAKPIRTDLRHAVANRVGSTSLILTLEVKRSGRATGAGRAVSTDRLRRRLDSAKVGQSRGVRSGHGVQRVNVGKVGSRNRAPDDVVQLNHVLVVHDTATNVPELDAVIDTKTGRCGGRQDETAVGRPGADTRVTAFDGSDLAIILLEVVNIDLASQVTETGNQGEPASRREDDGVTGAKREGVGGDGAVVEDGGLRGHVAVYDTELLGVGGPRHVVDRALLVKSDASVERAVGAQEVHVGLAVVALVGLVNLCLRQHNQSSSELVPLELDLVGLEEGLLRNRAGELGNVEDLDGGGVSL